MTRPRDSNAPMLMKDAGNVPRDIGNEGGPEMQCQNSPAAAHVLVIAVAALYGGMLYFRVATASLDDRYQPGIEALRLYASPGLLLGVLTLGGLVFRASVVARVAQRACVAALVVCVLLFGVVFTHSGSYHPWVFPEARTLAGTVQTALFSPTFSNRSTIFIIVSAGVALFWLAVSSWAVRTRRPSKPSIKSAEEISP